MSTPRALITWGGWEGHAPEAVAALMAEDLTDAGVSVDVVDTLDPFDDPERLASLDLIVPVWTKSDLSKERAENVSRAVGAGTGLAGCHGGMCDAFRDNVLWQFMTGGNWVAHPGGDGVGYRVKIATPDHPLVAGLDDFDVSSEQYYLHVDPAVTVLATTRFPVTNWFHSPNGPVDMPVAWTKLWGHGRVYYNALGHQPDVIATGPAREMLRRGLLWALEGCAEARAKGAETADFDAPGQHL